MNNADTDAYNFNETERAVIRDFFRKQQNLSIIDYHFGSKEFGYADILCANPDGRLVAVNFFLDENKPNLTLILNTFKFIFEMRINIKNLYTDFPINAELVPKIILLAPTFSEQCRRCIPFINFMDIDLISFAATVKHGVEQITFTHLTDASGDKPVFPLNKELDDVREQLKSIADDISEEEIDTFLKFYK